MIFLKTSSRFWLIFSLMTFLISCKENNHKQEITQIIQEWQGKEIVFPENIIFTQYGKDTIPFKISDSEYKVVIYVDSV